MSAVPPPDPQQPQQPAPAQYQPFVPQPGVVYPPQQGVAYPPQHPANPQFPNGVHGSAYRPGEGLQARVSGNYRWAFLLFALPGIIGIPVFIALIIWANLVR
jgi:hypothetical protein